jgi:hypothetical protein
MKENSDMSEFSKLSHEEGKKAVRLLASNPKPAQDFIDSTHENKGASMFLHDMSMVNYGDKMNIVGKEPSKKTGKSVPTAFVNAGSSEPKLSALQFASHFNRLKEHAKSKKALMGSWIDTNTPEATKKGVQIDLSGGYKDRPTAEMKMISRNEDAIVDASKGFEEIRHEDVRHKYESTPRPPKEN